MKCVGQVAHKGETEIHAALCCENPKERDQSEKPGVRKNIYSETSIHNF